MTIIYLACHCCMHGSFAILHVYNSAGNDYTDTRLCVGSIISKHNSTCIVLFVL